MRGSRQLVGSDAREAGGGEVTRAGTSPPQPTCPRDLKVGRARVGRSGGRTGRTARQGRRGSARASLGARACAVQGPGMLRAASRRPGPPPGQVAAASPLLLLLLLSCCADTCGGKRTPCLPGHPRHRLVPRRSSPL